MARCHDLGDAGSPRFGEPPSGDSNYKNEHKWRGASNKQRIFGICARKDMLSKITAPGEKDGDKPEQYSPNDCSRADQQRPPINTVSIEP